MAARRRDFIVYSVTNSGGRSRWLRVGVGFWNQKGNALTVLVDALPLSGRLVLLAPDEATAGEPREEG